MLHIKFGFDRPSGFREEDLWKWWTTTDGRIADHGHPISSPCEPNGSGELKMMGKSIYHKWVKFNAIS